MERRAEEIRSGIRGTYLRRMLPGSCEVGAGGGIVGPLVVRLLLVVMVVLLLLGLGVSGGMEKEH